MGAFNVVKGTSSCPNCGQVVVFDVQFKYGDTWQYVYRLGDTLRWGGNDIGEPGFSRVLVEGVGGPCSHYGVDNLDFDVILEKDRILGFGPASGGRETSGSEGFVVLKR